MYITHLKIHYPDAPQKFSPGFMWKDGYLLNAVIECGIIPADVQIDYIVGNDQNEHAPNEAYRVVPEEIRQQARDYWENA